MSEKNKLLEKRKKEFAQFLAGDEEVPHALLEATHKNMIHLMNPNLFTIIYKIIGVHLLSILLSLFVCHQFELNPFHVHQGLSSLMQEMLGSHGCFFGSGLYLMSQTIFLVSFILNEDEIRVLRKHSFSQTFALLVTTLIFILAFGGNILLHSTFFVWTAGIFVGGILSTEISYRLKTA